MGTTYLLSGDYHENVFMNNKIILLSKLSNEKSLSTAPDQIINPYSNI